VAELQEQDQLAAAEVGLNNSISNSNGNGNGSGSGSGVAEAKNSMNYTLPTKRNGDGLNRSAAGVGAAATTQSQKAKFTKSKAPIKGLTEQQRIKSTLDRLLTPGPPVHLPPAAPFPAKEYQAHTWGVPIMLKVK
jgi:hypothetical protein